MQPVRVLLVDDSLFFRSMLERELHAFLPAGSQIQTAGDPFEARDAILAFVPDVMVLDVEMPRMDGIEFLRKLLAQYDQPTIVLTGDARYESLARDAGARDFLQKPVGCSPEVFCEELARRIMRIAGKEKTDVGAVSGQIKLSLPSVTDLKCSATAGDVTLELESADFSLTATGIHPLSVTGFEYSEKDSVYTFGSGSGSAEINCISGKVRIVSK